MSISIHALREEGDEGSTMTINDVPKFLSTPSARRATMQQLFAMQMQQHISIHALREEGDLLEMAKDYLA